MGRFVGEAGPERVRFQKSGTPVILGREFRMTLPRKTDEGVRALAKFYQVSAVTMAERLIEWAVELEVRNIRTAQACTYILLNLWPQ